MQPLIITTNTLQYIEHSDADNARPKARRRNGSSTENLLLEPAVCCRRRVFRPTQIRTQEYAKMSSSSLTSFPSCLIRYHSIRMVSPALPLRNAFEPAEFKCHRLEPCPHNRAFADSSSGPTSIQLFSVSHYATYSDEAVAQRGERGWNSCCMAPAWKFRCRSSGVRES